MAAPEHSMLLVRPVESRLIGGPCTIDNLKPYFFAAGFFAAGFFSAAGFFAAGFFAAGFFLSATMDRLLCFSHQRSTTDVRPGAATGGVPGASRVPRIERPASRAPCPHESNYGVRRARIHVLEVSSRAFGFIVRLSHGRSLIRLRRCASSAHRAPYFYTTATSRFGAPTLHTPCSKSIQLFSTDCVTDKQEKGKYFFVLFSKFFSRMCSYDITSRNASRVEYVTRHRTHALLHRPPRAFA